MPLKYYVNYRYIWKIHSKGGPASDTMGTTGVWFYVVVHFLFMLSPVLDPVGNIGGFDGVRFEEINGDSFWWAMLIV